MAALLGRRAMLTGAGGLVAASATGIASARILPSAMVPLVGPGFKPTERDEIGLWQQMERVEEEIAGSNLLIKDAEVTGYLRDLIGTVGGPAAKDFRIYLARVPEFNAMMFPTGFAVVFSGLLLRMRNEAQLAGVIAHESGHFLRRQMIRMWRDEKRKSDLFAIGSMLAGVAGGAAGVYTGDLEQFAQLGTILSLFRYNRELEAEADAMGARLLAQNNYPVIEMSNTWEQLIGELNASARYRRKHRDRGYSLYATHPAAESRLADLKLDAAELQPNGPPDGRRARYLGAIGDIRPMLLDDQVKLNDPGASEFLVQTLARDGWNGLLRSAEADVWRLRNNRGDEIRAAQGYAAAVVYPDAPADAWRWHGLELIKSGQPAEGRAALARYLAMKPAAPDAPYIRQMIG